MENGKEASASRLPRWTRREMLALARAKQDVEGVAGAAASARGRRPVVPSPDATGGGGGGGAVPKWSIVSEGCRARGVVRGPTQCRKRWTNLIAAFRKIKKWEEEKDRETDQIKGYWEMGGEERKEKGLPGRFDRVVYEFMDGKEIADGGFEDCEHGDHDVVMDSEEEDEGRAAAAATAAVPLQSVSASGEPICVMPISMRRSPLFQEESPDPECGAEKQQDETPEQTTSKKQGPKRKRSRDFSDDVQPENTKLIKRLTETIERGTRLVAAQLEAQTIQLQMDRDLRKEQFDGILKACNRLADGVMKIAKRLVEKENSEKSNLTSAC